MELFLISTQASNQLPCRDVDHLHTLESTRTDMSCNSLWHALTKTITANVARASAAPALLSPQQSVALSYLELAQQAKGLSMGLKDRGVGPGSVVATDLPNVAEGILLHLACARLGASVATAKNAEGLVMPSISVAVTASPDSWLAQESFMAPPIVAGEAEMQSMLNLLSNKEQDVEGDSIDRPLGYFGSGTPLMHSTALQQGQDMARHFAMTPTDRVCVSITLYHAFGIGSACAAALQAGSAIVLPAVGGLQGCGIPSQRAETTLRTLESQKCTLLFCDSHTLKAFEKETLEKADLSSLRGGVCKTGSGTDILDETKDLKGLRLATLGKRN
jgi:acyl-coenzyme A synthetase/AMP-(fatty) acid ligase